MNIHAHPTKKIGVKPRPTHVKTCKLSKYLDLSGFPTPPPAIDWGKKAPNSTQLFKNDEIGDCAVAGYLHHKEIILQTAGLGINFADPTAVEIYQWATAEENGKGYTPDDPNTDTGLVLVNFLEGLRKRGLILAHAEIDLTNDKEVQVARYLYGGIYCAFGLPAAAQNMNDKWYVPNDNSLGDLSQYSWGGHCVNDKGRLANGSSLVTSWGKTIEVTPEFIKKYQTEGHIIVHKHTPQAFNSLFVNEAHHHIALKDLQSDLDALRK